MAFEETHNRPTLGIEYGFYIKLRLMTPIEQAECESYRIIELKFPANTDSVNQNPQWTLELDSIPAEEITQLLIS